MGLTRKKGVNKESMNTTKIISSTWSDYDKVVATTQLDNYGEILLDEYGCPIDDEYLLEEYFSSNTKKEFSSYSIV